MASKNNKTTPAKNTKKTPKKKGGGLYLRLVGILILSGLVAFLPTTAILCVGMVPTFVALVASNRHTISRAYCVAAINYLGCLIFILQLWQKGHSFDNAMKLLSDPITLITIYATAAVGYILNWLFVGIHSSLMKQRAQARLVAIKQKQSDLIAQWGHKITGSIPLDEDGFPIKVD